MYIPAKVEYGIRALLTLASNPDEALNAEDLAEAQGLPVRFLRSILNELRLAGIVVSQRGSVGGYRLGRPPESITLAEVFRRLDGPLAEVRGLRPEAARYEGEAAHLQEVWVAVRASLRQVLDQVTVQDVVSGNLPRHITRLLKGPDAWRGR